MKRRKRKTKAQLAAERWAAAFKDGMRQSLQVRAIEVAHYPAIGQVNFSVPVQRMP